MGTPDPDQDSDADVGDTNRPTGRRTRPLPLRTARERVADADADAFLRTAAPERRERDQDSTDVAGPDDSGAPTVPEAVLAALQQPFLLGSGPEFGDRNLPLSGETVTDQSAIKALEVPFSLGNGLSVVDELAALARTRPKARLPLQVWAAQVQRSTGILRVLFGVHTSGLPATLRDVVGPPPWELERAYETASALGLGGRHDPNQSRDLQQLVLRVCDYVRMKSRRTEWSEAEADEQLRTTCNRVGWEYAVTMTKLEMSRESGVPAGTLTKCATWRRLREMQADDTASRGRKFADSRIPDQARARETSTDPLAEYAGAGTPSDPAELQELIDRVATAVVAKLGTQSPQTGRKRTRDA